MTLSSPLISAAELESQLDAVKLVDCSHDLGMPDWGVNQYRTAHLPGATHAHLDRALSGPKNGSNGRHPLPDPVAFCAWLGEQGIGPDDHVVAYDRNGGMYAARLWWLLRWIGHARVQVLDGGLQAWVARANSLTAAVPKRPLKPYRFSSVRSDMTVDAKFLLANLAAPAVLVVDARSGERYRGEVEPIDPKAGHIPGAVNRPFSNNLAPDSTFKPADVLAAEWHGVVGDRPGSELVNQCGSGVTACHNILALELAGVTGTRLYPGSWSEWCSDPARPIATGAD